ncbi:MAG: septation protein SpoVG family protein, partial [Candidatus Omnitrophica bacterium]|nr:septation protein SpoVG family protein [Candidatus Omnitrophota bacterium]
LDDCFVIRDIKVIEGKNGLFVAMPSRKVKESCPRCSHRNVIDSNYCNQCGTKLSHSGDRKGGEDEETKMLRQGEHKDIAHPITVECREYVQRTILDAYQALIDKNQQEGRDCEID